MLNNAFMALETCSTFVERKCTHKKKCPTNKSLSLCLFTLLHLPCSLSPSAPTYLFTFLPTFLPPYLLTCLTTYLPTPISLPSSAPSSIQVKSIHELEQKADCLGKVSDIVHDSTSLKHDGSGDGLGALHFDPAAEHL